MTIHSIIRRRHATDALLAARSPFTSGVIDNLFMATVQKTGSQWFKKVLSDHRIVANTKLLPYPQRRYEYTEFKKRFPKGTFVPGLYMSYDLYEEIIKPEKYKTFYVVRDPRDIICSWYWSMKDTHGLMGKVGKFRDRLNQRNFDEGLHYCIDAFHMKLASMRTWSLNRNDPNLLIVRFEDIKSNPLKVIKSISDFSGFSMNESLISDVLKSYTKEKLRQKDLQTRPAGSESHYRSKSSDHRLEFKPEHFEHFYNSTGDLVDILGYTR